MKKKNIRNNGLEPVKIIRRQDPAVLAGLAPYPALRLLLPAVAGILSGTLHPFPLGVWIAAFLAALTLTLAALASDAWRRRGRFPSFPAALGYLALVYLAFGAYSDFLFNYVPRAGLIAHAGRTVVVAGRVAERPAVSRSGTSFMLEVDRLHEGGRERAFRERASVFVRSIRGEGPDVRAGDRVLVKGTVGMAKGPANRGEYDPHRRARLKRASAGIFSAGPWQIIHEDGRLPSPFERFLVRPVHDYIISTLHRFFPEDPRRQFMAGVLAGQRDGLDADLDLAFRRTGTAHILAVSGLHVGLLVLVVNLLLHRLRVTAPGRVGVFLLTVLILVVYGSVVGGAPSVKRASLMTVALLGGGVTGRKSFPLNSLAFADLVLLLLDPLELFSVGFQMTNAAVGGILLLLPRLHPSLSPAGGRAARAWHAIRGSLMLTVAASAGVAPLIALYFGTFSLVGIAANLPVVFFSSMMVYALLPALLLNLFSASAASLFAASAWFFSGLGVDLARWFSALPFASVPFSPGPAGVLGWYLALAALLLLIVRRGRRAPAIMLLLCAMNLVVWRPLLHGSRELPPSALTVNLGGDVAMLFSSGRESLQVDCGRGGGSHERIVDQVERFFMPPVAAVAAFASPDSLVSRIPADRRMLRGDALLRLPSILVFRPEPGVLRAWSRRRSLVMVKGVGGLRSPGGVPRKGDLAVVRLGRFRPKDRAALSDWLHEASPGLTVLVAAPFMPKAERAFLGWFAARQEGVCLRSKAGQVVFP
ncbi:ComEC family competence protein [Chlorobium sp. N1]|uniref:ComEC family competence protein n=1 Tax=Chlorobium sp. N1 TaxID=2491138 RepID=UPI0010394144|nr:ComEC family competence protein [Chlorobium sp. N1]TCD48525.1 ComEC family competence protein [Chlorobium sp. N1]